MTIPMRGIWKNGVLKGVLNHSQVMQRNTANKTVMPVTGIMEPPNKVHTNTNQLKTALPGSKNRQQPKLNPLRATPASNAQTLQTRTQPRFKAGTLSANHS